MNTDPSLTGCTDAPKIICHFHGKDHRTSCNAADGDTAGHVIFCENHWRDLWMQWVWTEPDRPRNHGRFCVLLDLVTHSDGNGVWSGELHQLKGLRHPERHLGVLNAMDLIEPFRDGWRLTPHGAFAHALEQMTCGDFDTIRRYADDAVTS